MTTEEFISSKGWGKPQYIAIGGKDVQKALIEFAKIHVKAALKEARKVVEESNGESILNAYPLNQIK